MQKYKVEDYGEVTLNHSMWMFCDNIDEVKAMKKGDKLTGSFSSGAGTSALKVEAL